MQDETRDETHVEQHGDGDVNITEPAAEPTEPAGAPEPAEGDGTSEGDASEPEEG